MEGLSIGAGIKYIFTNIDEYNASTFAASLGVMYNFEFIKELRCGAILKNIGPEIKFINEGDPLPLTFALGIAYAIDEFLTAVQLEKILYDDIEFGFGSEYIFLNTASIRIGYNTKRNYSLGLGLYWRYLELGYSFLPNNDIEASHIISLRFSDL